MCRSSLTTSVADSADIQGHDHRFCGQLSLEIFRGVNGMYSTKMVSLPHLGDFPDQKFEF